MSASEIEEANRRHGLGSGTGGVVVAWLIYFGLQFLIHRQVLVTPRDLALSAEPGAIYLEGVRNVLRYGVVETCGVPMVVGGERRAEDWVYYPNHPPLLVLGIAAVASLGLDLVVAGRVFMFLSWSLAAAAVFVLARRRYGVSVAALTGLLVSLASGIFRGGTYVEVVTGPVVPFSLWSVVAYLRYRERPSFASAALVFVLAVLAGLSDWPGLLVPAFLVFDRVLLDRRFRDPLLLMPLVALGVPLLWRAITKRTLTGLRFGEVEGEALGGIFSILAGRINEGPVDPAGLGGPSWHRILESWSAHTFTVPTLGVAGFGLLVFLCRAISGRTRPAARGVLLGIFIPVAYIAIFVRGAVIHPFWNLSLIPPLALLIAEGVDAIAVAIGRIASSKLSTGTQVAVIAVLLFFEVQSGLLVKDARKASLTESNSKILQAAEALKPILAPSDRVAVLGDLFDQEYLAFDLDRHCFSLHPHPEALIEARRLYNDCIYVLCPALVVTRYPALAASLVPYPFVELNTPSFAAFLFDLGVPPRLPERTPKAIADQLEVAGKAASAKAPLFEKLPEEDTLVVDPAFPKTTNDLRVGLSAHESRPLSRHQGGDHIPIKRFPPGRFFVSCVRDHEGISIASKPLLVLHPVESSYLLRGYLQGTIVGLSTLLIYFLLARTPKKNL